MGKTLSLSKRLQAMPGGGTVAKLSWFTKLTTEQQAELRQLRTDYLAGAFSGKTQRWLMDQVAREMGLKVSASMFRDWLTGRWTEKDA